MSIAPANSWAKASKVATAWAKAGLTALAWSTTARFIASLGAIMDDSVYQIDDSTLTMDDTKYNPQRGLPMGWSK